MEKINRFVFGLILGAVCSVFLCTIFIMLTSYWLLAYIFPVAIPSIVICTIFIVLSLKKKFETPGYIPIIMVALIGIPLAYWVPVKLQTLRFASYSSSIPIRENESKEMSHLSVFGADSPSMVVTEIRGSSPIPDMLKYYDDFLRGNAWSRTDTNKGFLIREYYSYEKGRSKVHLVGYTSGQKSEFNTVRLTRTYPTLGF